MSAVAIPPRIPGDSTLKTLEVQILKVEEEVVVDGDIECDSLTAVTTVTAGTGVTAVTGNVTAVAGNLVATAGTLSLSAAKAGTLTLLAGVATEDTDVVLSASDRIFVSRRTSGGAAFGTPTVVINATGAAGVASFTVTSLSPADGTTTVVTDVGVLDWVVVNSSAFA